MLSIVVVTCVDLNIDNSDTTGASGVYNDMNTVNCDFGYQTLEAAKQFSVTCLIPATVVNNNGHFGSWDGYQYCLGMNQRNFNPLSSIYTLYNGMLFATY